jgi:hypothetical protein
MNSFFTLHSFLEVGKTQDLPSKFWQTLGDALNSVRVEVFQTLSICFVQPPHMISWALNKFHDFHTSYEFYTILNPLYLMIFIMIRETNTGDLASFHVHGLRDVSWT